MQQFKFLWFPFILETIRCNSNVFEKHGNEIFIRSLKKHFKIGDNMKFPILVVCPILTPLYL